MIETSPQTRTTALCVFTDLKEIKSVSPLSPKFIFLSIIKSDRPSLIFFTDAGWWGEEMQILAGQNRRRIAVAVPTEEGMKEEERFC